ncbi:armadillo-type protein [Calycina marina]|uniref:Armadillo-type protein n=1 Tax=Calycina marina TaxID=1763456 RepID=A0A9P8CFR7_9HELO|nr:armadillo-type protein [Calycina marina]
MAQEWVSQLRKAKESFEQTPVLRALKNHLIGHPANKQAAVALGVLDPIVRLVYHKPTSKSDGRSQNHTLTEDELVRLQGLQVIASIAAGGAYFLPKLQSASVLPAILSNICPLSNPPQIVLASICTLSNLADAVVLASTTSPLSTIVLADALFSRQHLNSLCQILSQTPSSINVQCQMSTTASLLSRVCREERHQQSLASSGVLDALATQLVSFVVADGFVIPGADMLAHTEGLLEFFPVAAPCNANLSVILDAISVIIADSKLRASQLLYSPSMLAVFPSVVEKDFVANQNAHAAWKALSKANLNTQQTHLNAIDFLLPCIPSNQTKSVAQASAFPPLGTSTSSHNLSQSVRKYNGTSLPSWNDSPIPKGPAPTASTVLDAEDPESPLIAYLILILRSRRNSMERLMAASVLTILSRVGLTSKTRETALGLLVVPILVQMLEDPIPPAKSNDSATDLETAALDWIVKERAPAVLAMLITDSEYLQKAAFDAGVTNKLSKMLKISYDPVDMPMQTGSWTPHHTVDSGAMDLSQLGELYEPAYPPLLVHKLKVRESSLKAIAALVPFKDEYRKAIAEQGIIPYIVESLKSTPSKPMPKSGDATEKTTKGSVEKLPRGYGKNPVNIIVAACGAIRALSRSVSVLRTTLIDNGIAMPVFKLLKHRDIEIQIASTAAVCNLVTDISPMKDVVTESGVLKILCEHARSGNSKLRLNAVWALKHFVHGVSNDMKRTCLEELGQGWLVQLICDDTEDEALVRASDGESSAIGGDDLDEDAAMDQFEDTSDTGLHSSSVRPSSQPSSSRSKSIQQAEARLALLREAEANPAKKARNDDILVQEQGLDFIRNFIGGGGHGGMADTTEMIDYLFSSLGQDRVFGILASKLRPRIVNPFSRRNSFISETRVIPPQAEIIQAVAFILVHMAASIPRHRQLVISQTELLKLLVPQFNHPSIEVRLALCWLVANLTWLNDANDGHACATRANELIKLGFLTKLEMLEGDAELDVRERAKTALWQVKQARPRSSLTLADDHNADEARILDRPLREVPKEGRESRDDWPLSSDQMVRALEVNNALDLENQAILQGLGANDGTDGAWSSRIRIHLTRSSFHPL